MDYQSYIEALRLPEVLVEAVTVAGQAVLNLAPEIQAAAGHPLDVFNAQYTETTYGGPAWEFWVTDDNEQEVHLFDIVEFPIDYRFQGVAEERWVTDRHTAIYALKNWVRSLRPSHNLGVPVHFAGMGAVLGGLLFSAEASYTEFQSGGVLQLIARFPDIQMSYLVILYPDSYLGTTTPLGRSSLQSNRNKN